ncbi:sulfatase family protein, partial [Streptomyces sp. 4N509B]|uniref:sulfatase family protein n=1 Tax=Streptomyces sp. 4N509B TaxID=3457413 RepID=UPI003FD66D02
MNTTPPPPPTSPKAPTPPSPTRRAVLQGSGAVGLTALAGATAATPARAADGAAPNVLVVYCDDLGYGDPSCYGSPLVRTPVIDGMARRGMRLTDFYAGAPTCTPSRAALLTGCYAPRVNLANVLFPDHTNGLAAQETTLAEYLRSAGYATAHIGKWHLGNPAVDPALHPMEHGFDRYFGLPYSNDMTPLPLYDDREIVEQPPDQSVLTRRYAEEAIAFVRDHADQPFFVYLAHTQPHEPLASEFAGRSAAGPHGDSVEEIDHYLGVLLDELDALDVRENTCVIFTSDNGPWYVGSAGDLYGRKAETYEGGQRVPFVVEWPAVVPAGVTYREPACLVDVLPTLLEAAGVEPDPDRVIDGRSILPALTSGRPVDRGDVFYYDDRSTPSLGNCNAVRRGDWKLHVRRVPGPYFTGRGFSATEELPQLFNLARDPGETYDLSRHHPEIVAALGARITEFDAALRADHAARYGSPS